MATSERPHYQQSYNNPTATTSGNVVSAHQVQQQQMVHPDSPEPAVVVTQPLVIVTEPRTKDAFIASLIGTIFFCCICGIPGMLLVLKARLYILENKLEQARLTVKVVWVFCGLTFFFGILTWVLVGVRIIIYEPFVNIL